MGPCPSFVPPGPFACPSGGLLVPGVPPAFIPGNAGICCVVGEESSEPQANAASAVKAITGEVSLSVWCIGRISVGCKRGGFGPAAKVPAWCLIKTRESLPTSYRTRVAIHPRRHL